MIVFSVQIVAPDENRNSVLSTLGSILGPTRVAPGCLNARLYADLDNQSTVKLVEEWGSRAEFERHLDLQMIRTLVAVIELSGAPPVVCIDDVQRKQGIEELSAHRSLTGGGDL